MDYNDILSDYQENLQYALDLTDIFQTNYSCYYLDINGRLTTQCPPNHASNIRDKICNRYNEMKQKYINVVNDINNDECYLLDIQIENYQKNCDGVNFLHYKNWGIYDIKIKSLKHLRLAFGQNFAMNMEEHDFDEDFTSNVFYQRLSKKYYERYTKDEDDERFESLFDDERKYIQIKNIHCEMILNKIDTLSKLAMNETLDALYCGIPSFPCDIFIFIMDYLSPFPQIPPEPTVQRYDDKFDTEKLGWYDDMKFSISQTKLISDFYIGSDEDGYGVKICFDDDDDETDCKFDVIDTGLSIDLEQYILREIYHLYVEYGNVFVVVGQLHPVCNEKEETLFLYLDFDEYRDIGRNTLILSRFWMDLWNKIISDCIKVDCYNNAKFPETDDYHYNDSSKDDENMEVDFMVNKDIDIIYEYEYE